MKKRFGLLLHERFCAHAISGLAVPFLLAGCLYGEELFEVGNGKDKDPATYSFYKDSRIRPLVTKERKEIVFSDVEALYGKEFTVYEDGVDVCSVEYTWKQGLSGNHPILQPRYVDLSDWEKVKVEPGYVAIDPKTGRFKFSQGNTLDREDAKGVKFIARVDLPNLTPVNMIKHGNFIFATHCEETKGVVSVDVSDPHHIKFADSVPMHAFGRCLVAQGNYCYVSTIAAIQVVDISDPYHIKVLRRYYHNKGDGLLYAKGNALYHGLPDGIRIFDISEPASMTIANIIPVDGYISGMQAVEDSKLMYVAYEKKISIYSMEPGYEIKKLKEVGGVHSICDKANALQNSLILEGNNLYFRDIDGVRIFDLSDPLSPKQISFLETPSHTEYTGLSEFSKDGDFIYLAMGMPHKENLGGIRIVDVKDPSNPRIIKAFLTQRDDPWWGDADYVYKREYACTQIRSVLAEGGYLYALQPGYGFRVFDVHNPEDVKFLSSVITSGETRDISFIKDKVYASGVGLHIVDPFPAENPRLSGSRYTDHYNCAGIVYGQIGKNYIMHAGWGGDDTRIMDVSDPANQKIVDWDPPWNKWRTRRGVWLKDHMYFISSHGLLVYDMTSPEKPVRIFPKEDPTPVMRKGVGRYAWSIELRDKNVYLSYTSHAGLVFLVQVYDISVPDSPKLLGEWEGEQDSNMIPQNLLLKDNWLFLPGTHAKHGMRVLDISDPANMKVVNTVRYFDPLFSQKTIKSFDECKIKGKLMYVATYGPLQIFDASNLPEVKYLDTYFDRDDPWSIYAMSVDIEIYGKYLYKNTIGSVDILEIPCPSEVPKGRVEVKFGGR